jgi:hypothetical protein
MRKKIETERERERERGGGGGEFLKCNKYKNSKIEENEKCFNETIQPKSDLRTQTSTWSQEVQSPRK